MFLYVLFIFLIIFCFCKVCSFHRIPGFRVLGLGLQVLVFSVWGLGRPEVVRGGAVSGTQSMADSKRNQEMERQMGLDLLSLGIWGLGVLRFGI